MSFKCWAAQVSAGERTVLERKPRYGPNGNRTTARKLPSPLLTNDVSKDVVEECEGALAAIVHRWEGPEMVRRDADRSVHAHAGADEDDNDEVCQVQGVTPSRTMQRSGKNVLPFTDPEGNLFPLSQPEVEMFLFSRSLVGRMMT